MNRRVYLDHNAGAPLRPAALAVLQQHLGLHGNPSSAHAEGRRARALLEDARERLAACLGADRDGVVFTSGGTESNALALAAAPSPRPIAVAATEHPAVLENAARHPGGCVVMTVDAAGRVRRDAIPGGVGMLSLSTANHETGQLQDLVGLFSSAHEMGVMTHTDASQAVGRVPVDLRAAPIDLLSLGAHKLGGPVGVGAVLARDPTALRPLVRGGGQEAGVRGGTESAVLAAAFAAAAEDAVRTQHDCALRWRAWSRDIREGISGLDPTAVFHSPAVDGLPNTVCVSFPGRRGPALVHRLDLEGVAVSHGSACSTGSLRPSPVLLAMGCSDACAHSVVRISWGHDTTRDDLRALLSALRVTLAAVLPAAR